MAWNQNSTHMDERRKQLQTEERMGALGADMCVSMRRWVGDGSVIHSLYIRYKKRQQHKNYEGRGGGTLVVIDHRRPSGVVCM